MHPLVCSLALWRELSGTLVVARDVGVRPGSSPGLTTDRQSAVTL